VSISIGGVIDTAHHWSSATIFPLKICITELITKIFGGVIDNTADHKIGDFQVGYLAEFESILGYQGPRWS
jgi:hypothetical protein